MRNRISLAEPGISKAEIVAAGASEQLLGIQALRFIAAFAVVILHCTFYTQERLAPHFTLFTPGAAGVRLFFVISGFVMIASSHRLEGTPLGWRVFAAKRVVRIVPMYWLVTTFKLLTLLAAPAVVLHSVLEWDFIAKSYAFIPELNKDGEIHPLLGVGWTLNFEMFFYLLFGIALSLRIAPLLFITPFLAGLSILSLYRDPSWPVPLQFWADPIVLDFLAGMILATLTRRGIRMPVALGWIAASLGCIYLFSWLPRPGPFGSLSFSLAQTLAATLVVAGTVSIEEKIGPRLPKWILTMGGASYVLYLIHPLIAPAGPVVMNRLHLNAPWLSVFVSLTLAMVAAMLAYRFIEQPLTRRVNRFARAKGLYEASRPTFSPSDLKPSPANGTD